MGLSSPPPNHCPHWRITQGLSSGQGGKGAETHQSWVCFSKNPSTLPSLILSNAPLFHPRAAPEESAPGEVQRSDWLPSEGQPPHTGHPHRASLSVSMADPLQLPPPTDPLSLLLKPLIYIPSSIPQTVVKRRYYSMKFQCELWSQTDLASVSSFVKESDVINSIHLTGDLRFK